MSRTTTGPVRDARPPEPLVRALNPFVRRALRSPLGRRIRPLALLEYVGRRSGVRRRVVAAWHELDGRGFVVTPAGWQANFVGGAPALVRHCGRTTAMTGTVQSDPVAVARTLQQLFDAGDQARTVGLAVDDGHAVTPDDVIAVRRTIVWFDPIPSTLS
jgi:hypothetical protein